MRSDKGKQHKKASHGDKRLGNKFHKLRKSFGRDKIIKNPKELWDSFVNYMEWCDENPIIRYDSIKSGEKAGKTFPVQMPRVYTIQGFANYIGIIYSTLKNYESNDNYKEFHNVYEKIKGYIEDDKLTNGMVGNYDPRIVMSMLGIKEKQEIEGKITLNFEKEDANI